MRIKLTVASVNALEARDEAYDARDTVIAGFALRVRPNGNNTFLLFYRNDAGQKRTYTIGKGLTVPQARQIAERLYADVRSGVDLNKVKSQKRAEGVAQKNAQLGNFLEGLYHQSLVENRKSGEHAYRRIRRSFEGYLNTPMDELSQLEMQRWARSRLGAGVSKSTLNNDVAELKAMLNKARQWGVISRHNLGDYRPPRAVKTIRVRYLSKGERERLYSALNCREQARIDKHSSGSAWRVERGYEPSEAYIGYTDHLKPMVLIAINTGMRRGELFNLEWADIKDTHARISAENSKSGKERYIPLNTKAVKVLRIWGERKSKSGLVFPSKDGKPFNNIYKAWNKLLASADIKDFKFHDLRHDFASCLVMKGVDLYAVKELLGHSTIQVTERYAHLAPQKLADAVNTL